MLKHIKRLFGVKPAEPQAPYKVETPSVNYEDIKPAPAVMVPVQAEEPAATEAVVESKPAKKPRKPRAPKVEKALAVKKPRAPRKSKSE